jgi:glycerophosphoryl diester phosphodiesterase
MTMALNQKPVQVLAHRGASRAERENTVEAFKRAREMGAHGVELDVRRTLDDHLVVHHDPRTHDGGVICEMLAGDLPAHIPSLSQALDACEGMWVNLEIKNDEQEPDFDPSEWVAEQTMRLLAERGEPQRWLMSSFRLETMNRCRQLAPHIRTAWLVVEVPDNAVAVLLEYGHAALHPWVKMLSKDVIDDCHVAGIAVNTWTCDDPLRMSELIAWGIDGICTNVPDVAAAVIADQLA